MRSHADVVAALVLALAVLLGSSAAGANAALRVRNDLTSEIEVEHPPACQPCIPHRPCPLVCIEGIFVESGKEGTLDSLVTYPLAYLKVEVQDEASQVYCVPAGDLKQLTATAELLVGPGDCGLAFPNSITAVVVDGLNRYVTCLQPCSA